jgi:sarcosine oxidase subunit beta
MPDLPPTAEVVIVGGGVMGASAAHHLAQRGVKDVVLLERGPFFGQGATGKCAGGVRHQFATEVNIRLSLASLKMLEDFEAETGQAIDLRWCGYLFVLTREDDAAAFRKNVALQHALGVMTEWLSGDEVRRRVPLLHAPDALAGTFYARDGLADPNGVVMGYVNAARRRGVTCLTGVEVTGIQRQGSGEGSGKVTGVKTNRGQIATPLVVNTAGPWAARVGEMAGVTLPIQPLRRQMLTTTPLPGLPPDFPFVIDFAQSLYFHREGEGLLTGMSNPHERPGFDESVDEDWEVTHLEAAVKRLPLLEQAGRAAHWAGLYEMTPDAHPIIGPTPVAGFTVCAGFSGHGFMHGPICGQLMAELIVEGQARSVDISALSLSRFARGKEIREYNVV